MNKVVAALRALANPEKARFLQGYFKISKGEYAEGDVFWGITVPALRKVARQFKDFDLKEVEKLLHHKVHECRFVALEILVFKFSEAEPKEQEKIVRFYLKNRSKINNWDLVDTSARDILGTWLLTQTDISILDKLVRSRNVWDRRIAIVSTHAFIQQNQFEHTIRLAGFLLPDNHDLIHKASGWMLREVGKRNEQILTLFLDQYAAIMPRTMLRYALERLPVADKQHYMNVKKVIKEK